LSTGTGEPRGWLDADDGVAEWAAPLDPGVMDDPPGPDAVDEAVADDSADPDCPTAAVTPVRLVLVAD
jgi:hypothetical protein